MGKDVKKITKFIDNYLETHQMEYITPPEANELLAEAGLLRDNKDRPGKPLRELLRHNKFPHAYQEGSLWRIPKSINLLVQGNQNDLPICDNNEHIISAKKICHMLQSDLGIRMRQAQKRNQLYREQQFVIGIPMNQVYPEVEETDLELVQGIIDAYFEEDDELVLMDYKTDRAPKDSGAKELSEKYREQLNYYKKTLEQLTGKRVKETYIYSFSLEEVIMVEV